MLMLLIMKSSLASILIFNKKLLKINFRLRIKVETKNAAVEFAQKAG